MQVRSPHPAALELPTGSYSDQNNAMSTWPWSSLLSCIQQAVIHSWLFLSAGVPQTACNCQNCTAVWVGHMPRQFAVSAAIIDKSANTYWLLDCTPDFKDQHHLLQQHLGKICTLTSATATAGTNFDLRLTASRTGKVG